MITLFLGAGASKPFDYPTTEDFIKLSDKKFSSHHLYRDIMAFLKNRSEIIDIEEVLWELEKLLNSFDIIQEPNTFKRWFYLESERAIYNHQGKTHKLASVIPEIVNSSRTLRSEIDKLVYDTYWKEPNGQAQTYYRSFFGALSKTPPFPAKDYRIDIFTTNYDLIIERFFEDKRNVFSDGFSPNYRRSYVWHIDNYTDKKIRLFKLHGSVDWKQYENDENIYCIPQHDFTKHRDNVIIYPGYKGQPVKEPFITIHNQFKESLLQAERCLFVGFSFRDDYLNKLIQDALIENTKLQLVIWNPVKVTTPFPENRIFFFENYFGSHDEAIPNLLNVLHLPGF